MAAGDPISLKGRFQGIFIPYWLQRMSLPASAKFVYARAAGFDDGSGRVWFKQEDVAEELGLDVATVKRAVAVLEQRGLWRVERAEGRDRLMHRASYYAFLEVPEMSDSPCIRPRSQSATSGGGSVAPSGGGTDAPSNGVMNGSKENPTPPTPSPAGPVETVFNAWVESTGRTGRTRLDSKRRSRIRGRLREGFPVEDLVDAVRGWKHSPFHRGENETGTLYTELDVLLRDAQQVEKFRDLERASRGELEAAVVVGPGKPSRGPGGAHTARVEAIGQELAGAGQTVGDW